MELLIFVREACPRSSSQLRVAASISSEDEGMVAAVAQKIEHGELQLFCVTLSITKAGMPRMCRTLAHCAAHAV